VFSLSHLFCSLPLPLSLPPPPQTSKLTTQPGTFFQAPYFFLSLMVISKTLFNSRDFRPLWSP
jgi:hypothetical protein